MNVQYAILGFLSRQPLSGYDLKKLFASSTFLYWSGNSNQIYRALIDLHNQKLVTYQVQQQENVPAKKVYSITAAGRAALREWVLAHPEPPEIRSTFLIQLAWAGELSDPELESLLAQYESEIQTQLQMQREDAQRDSRLLALTGRDAHMWGMIQDNLVSFYENEMAWVRRLRRSLTAKEKNHERNDPTD